MSWLEGYIDEGKSLLESTDTEEIGRYIDRIRAVKNLVEPTYGFNYSSKAYKESDNETQLCLAHEDVKIIINALTRKAEGIASSFSEKYGTATLDDHIRRCRAIIDKSDDAETAEAFCNHVACVYTRKIPLIKESLSIFSPTEEKNYDEDVAKLLEFLLVYRDDIVKSHKAPALQIDSNDLLYALFKDKLEL